MSGVFGLLSLFTGHPISFVQWIYYTLNCFVLLLTAWCYVSIRKLVLQGLTSNNSSSFLNQESNMAVLKILASFVIIYTLDLFSGNIFMVYLTKLWFEEEYHSDSPAALNSATGKTISNIKKPLTKYLAKRVSEKLSLQSASETYEVFVSLITIIITEITRFYFISIVLSYYLRLRKRIARQQSGKFAFVIDVLDRFDY